MEVHTELPGYGLNLCFKNIGEYLHIMRLLLKDIFHK